MILRLCDAGLLLTDTDSFTYEIKTNKILTKISASKLRNGLTLMTTRLIIHLQKPELIVKCLDNLRMKLAARILLNLLVSERKLNRTKCLMEIKEKKCKRDSKNVVEKSIEFGDYRMYFFSRQDQHRKRVSTQSEIIVANLSNTFLKKRWY